MKIIFVPSCGIGFEIVDGKRVIKQDSLTTTDTKIRCDAGAEFFKKIEGEVNIVCTGGIFLPPFLQTKPASSLMKEYLISVHGIPPEKIWTEEKSLDSWENVEMTRRTLQERGIKEIEEIEIFVVSHWPHALRLKRLFRYQGFHKVKSLGLHYPVGWRMWVLELLNNILTLIDPTGKSKWVKKERERRRTRDYSLARLPRKE